MKTDLKGILEALVLSSIVALPGCGDDKDDGDTGTNTMSASNTAPGTEAGCPGTTAGCPGTTAGCPGTTAGCPGTTAGCPGTTGGCPTSTG